MYKLSPSDFKYLYEDCKHCYYHKVKNNLPPPSGIFPGIFTTMNNLLQNAIVGMDLRKINPALPAGTIEVKEGFLKSKLIPGTDCYVSGRFDVASKLNDGTYSVIDFKITNPKEDKMQRFTHQLHAYKYALENPEIGEAKKVSKMGVIAVHPNEISFNGDHMIFKANPHFFEIEEDMDGFYEFVKGVSTLLNGSCPPENPNNCQWCRYRQCFQPETVEDIPF